MLVSVYYGKMNKNGWGHCDIFLGKCDLDRIEDFIEENKSQILKGYTLKKGDYIEIAACDGLDRIVYIKTIE